VVSPLKMHVTTRAKLILFSVLTAAVLLAAAYVVSRPSHEPASNVRISFTGLLADPINITLEDIRSMPNTTVRSELICVSGESLGVHNWTGVKLKDLLGERGVLEGAIKVAFFATTAMPLTSRFRRLSGTTSSWLTRRTAARFRRTRSSLYPASGDTSGSTESLRSGWWTTTSWGTGKGEAIQTTRPSRDDNGSYEADTRI